MRDPVRLGHAEQQFQRDARIRQLCSTTPHGAQSTACPGPALHRPAWLSGAIRQAQLAGQDAVLAEVRSRYGLVSGIGFCELILAAKSSKLLLLRRRNKIAL